MAGARFFRRLQRRRQMMRVQDLGVADDQAALDGVLELAHVARPVIAHQHVDRRRGDALHVLAVLQRELLQEVVGEQQDVGLALAQRRHEDREHVQAIVEILAEIAGGDGLFEVLVGGGDEPHVRRDRLGAAQPLELALLQDPQQLHLRGEVELADFVEKERAAFRQFEASLLRRVGAGERAFFVAEQLRLDQILRQRRAAHLDERLLGARASCSGWRARSAPCRCPIRHAAARSCWWARPARPVRRPPASRGWCRPCWRSRSAL